MTDYLLYPPKWGGALSAGGSSGLGIGSIFPYDQKLRDVYQQQMRELREQALISGGVLNVDQLKQWMTSREKHGQQSDVLTDLKSLKKSVKAIELETITEGVKVKVQERIERLKKLGLELQARMLEHTMRIKVKISRVKEWDYKVLPQVAIDEFETKSRNWDNNGGRKVVHIDRLEEYHRGEVRGAFSPAEAEELMPEFVLDKLEEAQERQVFDEFAVLWVERVKDPLLLGKVDGCQDYFFICEWDDDVKFADFVKDKK